MDENIEIEISETNRGKEQIIINKKYKYNFSKLRKDNSKKYRCTEYKTLNKCKSFIVLNDNKEILEYESLHNHFGKEFDVSISLTKHKMKEEIRKSSIPFDVKRRRIYNEISQEMGFICPEYNSIKSQISRSINKQLPPEIKSFDEIPDESEFYKTVEGENFMIFKNHDLIIFQSPFQAKLFIEYKENIFADGTFYIAPIFSYQVFITRTYIEKLNCFYTTSFSILRNKEQGTYEKLFEEIKKNISNYSNDESMTLNFHCNSNNNKKDKKSMTLKFHCDFEIAISNAAKNIFPDINIKYCIWHYKRSLEVKKNELCRLEVKQNKKIKDYYIFISNFPFINPEYINVIFEKIKSDCTEHKHDQFLKFLEYFEYNYLNIYKPKYWNYYNNIEHITNNASESYNNYLNNLFEKKTFFL